jgi:DnaJ-class molecular chaperone
MKYNQQQPSKILRREGCSPSETKSPLRSGFNIEIEKGMRSGDLITLPAAGEQDGNTIPGDVVFELEVRDKQGWERRGSHLYRTLEISLRESILGFERQIVRGNSFALAGCPWHY